MLTSSRSWKVLFDVLTSSKIQSLTVRSIAIDHMKEKFKDQKVAVVYVYFDYKEQHNQKASVVVANLLRQLVCGLDHIPPQLEKLHDSLQHGGSGPSLSILCPLFGDTASQFDSVYVILDALDECDPSQIDLIITFLQGQKENVRILLTMREHLCNISEDFKDHTFLPIRAGEGDVRNYLQTKLAKGKFAPSLQNKIVETLTSQAEGMYAPVIYHNP